MTRRVLRYLVFCAAGVGIPQPSLKGQEPTPVIPPPATSSSISPIRVTEKPIAFTPIEEAQNLYLMGEFDQAVERYQSLIRGGADDAVAYAGMARAYLKLEKPDKAYTAASKAVELDPFLATAHSALGEVYFRQGQLYEAQTRFLFPFKQGQQDARSYLGLARLYLASFNSKRAKVAIDKAYSLSPHDPEISGEWLNTRPIPEQIKAMEALLASPSGFYSRRAVADIRHRLAMMKDEVEHPERTCSLVNPPERDEMPLVLAGNADHPSRMLALEVAVNGAKSKLVIGTGEQGIVINGKIARKAHVEAIIRTDEEGLGKENPPESYAGFVRSIKVGAFEFRNCYLTVDERVAPGSYFDYFDGSIDAVYFHNYLVDLDMPHARLRLEPLPQRPATEDQDGEQMNWTDPDAAKFHDRYTAPDMSTWTQLYRFGNLLAVPTQFNESPPELFDISTAAERNVISADFARNWATLEGTAPPMFGINGRIDNRFTGTAKLQFAGLVFYSTAENSADLTTVNERVGTQIEGTLGFEVLHNLRTEIDYRDGLIHFENGPAYYTPH